MLLGQIWSRQVSVSSPKINVVDLLVDNSQILANRHYLDPGSSFLFDSFCRSSIICAQLAKNNACFPPRMRYTANTLNVRMNTHHRGSRAEYMTSRYRCALISAGNTLSP
jgi:hypothetical protein